MIFYHILLTDTSPLSLALSLFLSLSLSLKHTHTYIHTHSLLERVVWTSRQRQKKENKIKDDWELQENMGKQPNMNTNNPGLALAVNTPTHHV